MAHLRGGPEEIGRQGFLQELAIDIEPRAGEHQGGLKPRRQGGHRQPLGALLEPGPVPRTEVEAEKDLVPLGVQEHRQGVGLKGELGRQHLHGGHRHQREPSGPGQGLGRGLADAQAGEIPRGEPG
jgi:hypothetical protein